MSQKPTPEDQPGSKFPRLGRVCLLYWGERGHHVVWPVSVGRSWKGRRRSHTGITDCGFEEVGAIVGVERGGVWSPQGSRLTSDIRCVCGFPSKL